MHDRLRKLLKSWPGRFGVISILLVVLWRVIDALGNVESIWEYRYEIFRTINSPVVSAIILLVGFTVLYLELQKQNWLYSLAEKQKKEIGNYVFVKSVFCKHSNSLDSDPEFSFELDIMNTSVFDVRVHKEIDDNIDFKNRQLRGLKFFVTLRIV